MKWKLINEGYLDKDTAKEGKQLATRIRKWLEENTILGGLWSYTTKFNQKFRAGVYGIYTSIDNPMEWEENYKFVEEDVVRGRKGNPWYKERKEELAKLQKQMKQYGCKTPEEMTDKIMDDIEKVKDYYRQLAKEVGGKFTYETKSEHRNYHQEDVLFIWLLVDTRPAGEKWKV